jgi:hypothetical protein
MIRLDGHGVPARGWTPRADHHQKHRERNIRTSIFLIRGINMISEALQYNKKELVDTR